MNNLPADLLNAVAKIAGTQDIEAFSNVLAHSIMPRTNNGQSPRPEEITAFLMVAKEYKLNPMTKEIYAFPSTGGGIQPIVSIDGWLKIINNHPQFNGMEFVDSVDNNGVLQSVTCRVYRKDREHATEMTEYMAECRRGTQPWKQWPNRMLRHKATIQAARYAFGFSGIVDPDEAERIESAQPERKQGYEKPEYPPESFDTAKSQWRDLIESGKRTSAEIINTISTKYTLSAEQETEIRAMGGQSENA